MAENDSASLENLPAILMVGSSNVGKRALLSRLLPIQFDDDDLESDLFARVWKIDTKYYTADVALWMANLSEVEELRVNNLTCYSNLAALVMVFDLNDLKSFDALRKWAITVDLSRFDVLLCIGNKVDLVEAHPAHVEYKRRLIQKNEDFEVLDYGAFDNEGIGLLCEEKETDSVVETGIKNMCVEWCAENEIEYVEACAANAEFDKCLSLDGDSQGVERLYGALSAHMWPGMVLKSGSGGKVVEPYLPQGEELLSDVESDFEFDYEVLSEGSAEPWNDADEGWVSANGPVNGKGIVSHASDSTSGCKDDGTGCSGEKIEPSVSTKTVHENKIEEAQVGLASVKEETSDFGSHFEFEDLERLMSEIGGMRDSLRLMPDFQRREMAAKLALRMAAMFGGDSEDDDNQL